MTTTYDDDAVHLPGEGADFTLPAEGGIANGVKDKDVGILVLKGSDMERIPPRLRITLENSVKPTVIAVGGEEGGLSMRERIKRSVGVDLWK